MQLALFSTTKICKQCKVSKQFTEFNKHSVAKDGLQPKCKQCNVITRAMRNSERNIDKVNEQRRRYHATNSVEVTEIRRESSSRYYATNSDKMKELNIAWEAINSEKRKEINRRYRADNLNKVREATRMWNTKNPEKTLIYCNRRRARKRNAAGDYDITKLNNRKAMYGNQCYLCGEEATAIDHVKPLANGGSNWPSNLRPICKSCNSSKGAKWPYELHHIQLTRFAEFSQKFN